VDSNFRAFRLAPVTWNILGYSLLCEQREKWRVVSRKFHKKKLWPLMKRHFFNPSDLINTKTTNPSGSAKSGGYIPRRFASRYISTPIHLPSGDSCNIYIHPFTKTLLFQKYISYVCMNAEKRLKHDGHTLHQPRGVAITCNFFLDMHICLFWC